MEKYHFADLARSIVTDIGLEDTKELPLVAEVIMRTYVSTHPTTEWTYDDITDEIRAEAPHLRLPDDVKFHLRSMWITMEPLDEIAEGCELLGPLGESAIRGLERLRQAVADAGGKMRLHTMTSTQYGMAVVYHPDWTPSEAEWQVLNDALNRVSIRVAGMDGEITVISANRKGGQTISRMLAGSAIDSIVAEASQALDDDHKVTSAIDAWANQYREGGES